MQCRLVGIVDFHSPRKPYSHSSIDLVEMASDSFYNQASWRITMQPKRARQAGQIMRIKEEAIGAKVVNPSGEDIGEIEEVVMDLTTGRATYAALSFGGFLGMGDKLFAVPWVSLAYDTGNGVFVLKANKELLEKAPGFDKDNWPDMSDPTRLSEICAYYGVEVV
jgi:sporulation protein YlmC with PRC-barrel domain